MKKHIDIAIIDNNHYFKLGVKEILRQYFSHKHWSSYFLQERYRNKADLVIQGNGSNPIVYHCRHRRLTSQHVMTLQDTALSRPYRPPLPTCLSERRPLMRNVRPQTLLAEVNLVLSPELAVSPEACPRCAFTLTPRELQVLSAMRQCITPQQTAPRLSIDPKTVYTHKYNIMKKLGFHRSIELYHWLQRGGLEQETRDNDNTPVE